MQIDNKKRTYGIWLQKLLVTVILTPVILFFSFSRVFDEGLLGFSRVWWITLFALIYLWVILYHRLTQPHYIYFSDHGNKIILRFFPVKAFNNKKHSAEIPKDKFVRFEIVKKRFFSSLVLYQRFNKGEGKFPPVPLSALNSKEREQIISTLKKYSSGK